MQIHYPLLGQRAGRIAHLCTSLCANVLNGLDAGEADSILRYCPRCPSSAQWIHVHARRLGSEAFRTVTGRQLPLA